jgi:hypothetical protein
MGAMVSSLALVLPRQIPDDVEAVILEKTQAKMRMGCSMAVRILRALEAHYGAEAKEVAHNVFGVSRPRPPQELGAPEKDLHDYLDRLEQACAGSHEWEKVVEEPDRIEYRFTRCMWAEIFSELGAADIGSWICEGDDPGVHAYNPRLRCRLTRTLMKGDSCCDHCFYVQQGTELGEHKLGQ